MQDNEKLKKNSLYGEFHHEDVADKDTSSIYEDVMITHNLDNSGCRLPADCLNNKCTLSAIDKFASRLDRIDEAKYKMY